MEYFATIVNRLLTTLNVVNYYARYSRLDVSRAMDTPMMIESCFLIVLNPDFISTVSSIIKTRRHLRSDWLRRIKYLLCSTLQYFSRSYCQPIRSQYTLSQPPENIRTPCDFMIFSRVRERVHWERMGLRWYAFLKMQQVQQFSMNVCQTKIKLK